MCLDGVESRVGVFEVMAPLTDSPFARHVISDQKVTPSEVAHAMLDRLDTDDFEMHLGRTDELYGLYQRSPSEAVAVGNAALGN